MKNIKFAIYGAMLLAVVASGPLFAQDGEVEVLTRLKFGPKIFDDDFAAAKEHSMTGLEVEVRWPKPGADEGSFQGLSLVLGLEDSSGDGTEAGGKLEIDIMEIDLGARYSYGWEINAEANSSICFYGGVGLAMLDGDVTYTLAPDSDGDGEGVYVEVGGYGDIPLGSEGTMSLVFGLGLKFTIVDVEVVEWVRDLDANPISYQLFVGLKF